MTIAEIIAIITTGVLCVLCVVCIVVVMGSKRQASINSRAIKGIEKSLSSFGDSMKEKTDQLIDQLEKQPDDAQTRRLEMLEEEVRRLSKIEEEIAAEIEAAVSAYDAADSEATAGGAAGTLDDIDEFDGIEELDGEIELDDLFRELDEAAQAQAAQQPAQQQFVQAQAAQPPQQPAEQQIPPQQFAAQQPVQQQQFVQPQQPAQQQVWQQIPDAAEQPQQPETGETRYHQGYNIGRSGRKYTAEELNMLIRE